MKKKSLFILWVIFISAFSAFAQMGTLQGVVTDKETNEKIPFANITIEDSTKTIAAATSDFDGNYSIDKIPPGSYTVNVSFVGYTTTQIRQVTIMADKILFLDIHMKPIAEMLETVEIIDYKIPLISRDQTASGATITAEEIARMPNRSGNHSATAAKGVSSQNGNRHSVRGARSNESVMYIDGIRVTGNPDVPQSAIEQNEDIFDGEPEMATKAQLTATELNDFSKWGLWSDLQKNELNTFQNTWEISPQARYCVQVMSQDNKPIVDAEVFLVNSNDSVVWGTRTDNTGKAELWAQMFRNENIKNLHIEVLYNEETYDYPRAHLFQKGINLLKIPAKCSIPDAIDIAFVVDATGSMDDEIEFLKTDLIDIIHHTSTNFPESTINLGSVFYRCFNNSYVTRMTPLSPDIERATQFIKEQSAGEGGDEVVEEAFMVAVDKLDWSRAARARLLFFVLDEQPLTNHKVIEKMKLYARLAAEKGIRVIPVVASAENKYHAQSLEYLMRSIALATNGTSIFLTDHSQIGNAHATPTTDQFDVELLNNLMKRIIYQFSYVPDCDEEISAEGVSDTTYLVDSPIIAHEIVDPSKSAQPISPKKRIRDYTISSDSLKQLNSDDTASTSSTDQNPDFTDKAVFSLKYYPNPTSGHVTLEIQGKLEELYLVDVSGKVIMKFNPNKDASLSIELDDFSNGIYFIKFSNSNGWHTSKVVLSR